MTVVKRKSMKDSSYVLENPSCKEDLFQKELELCEIIKGERQIKKASV